MAGQGARERPPRAAGRGALSLTLTIAAEISGRHPEVLSGGFVASNLTVAAAALADRPPPVDTHQELVARGLRVETITDEPIIADWRAAVAACGLKPSTHKSSPEQMARRMLKSGPIHTPLVLVDVYCDVSTLHLAPLGAYDVNLLPSEDVTLRLADPEADVFDPLGARREDMPLTPNVAVYASGNTVICWAYNCRDSRDTCLNADTEVGLFLGEAVTARQHDPLRAALADLSDRLRGAGAEVGPIVLADAGTPTVEIPNP